MEYLKIIFILCGISVFTSCASSSQPNKYVLVGSVQWVLIEKNDDGDSFYIDPQTLRKNGTIRVVWVIEQLAARDKDGEKSRRRRFEFDCTNERFRVLSSTTHSGPMTSGKLLATMGETQWYDIPPGTAISTKLEYVCAR